MGIPPDPVSIEPIRPLDVAMLVTWPGIVRPPPVCNLAKSEKLNGNTCDGSATAKRASDRTAAIEALEVCHA